MTLVLRKLLASSTFAIAGALDSMSNSAQGTVEAARAACRHRSTDELDEDYEALDETAEEWPEDDQPQSRYRTRIAQLSNRRSLTSTDLPSSPRPLTHNAKGRGAAKGAARRLRQGRGARRGREGDHLHRVRRTQDYLLRVLADSPFAEGIVLFNGTNTDERSQGNLRRTGCSGTRAPIGSPARAPPTCARPSSITSASKGRIMIATEAGAEGINLQFCSLVVNYDLPWNPQRIEQRIGRCHRYGQKHDVVVVNFLNRKNAADQRVFQLLSEKFKLFDGVFGASDEVLGAIESGVDFEKRIASIYQRCRQPDEIKPAFDQLQLELSLEINEAMSHTRQKLLENFDDEVREKLEDPRRSLQGLSKPLRTAIHAADPA